MKGCILAAAILLLVLGSVIFNAFYIRNTTNQLLAWVEALPKIPDPQDTPRAITEIRKKLEKKAPLLGITVPYATLDRVSEALISLESFAKTGDQRQYDVTLTLLVDLIEELGRTEKITVENIL